LSPLHCVAETRDRVASLAACATNHGLNFPHGFVNLTLGLQVVIAYQRADSLLDLALRLIDLPFALILYSTCEASRPRFMALDSTRLCQRATTAEQPDDEQYDGDDQQDMDERADRVCPDDSQQPGDQEKDGDGV
jgi:hypothetical protein